MSHSEIPSFSPEREKRLRHWDMETRADHPEDIQEMLSRAASHAELSTSSEMRWTHLDDDTVFIHEPRYKGSSYVEHAKYSGAKEWIIQHRAVMDWWHNLDKVEEYLTDDIFKEKEPSEQFIIGQRDRGIRFYNFDAPMSEDYQEELRKFVDIATQYMGDSAYDLLQDVVITRFAPMKPEKPGEEPTEKRLGFVQPGMDGVMFVNSELLTDNEGYDNDHIRESRLLQTLVHEFGHLIHGDDERARAELAEFAEAIGWNYKKMYADTPHKFDTTLESYQPPALYGSEKITVQMPNGQRRELNIDEYTDMVSEANRYYASGGKEGEPMPQILGSPTEYGARTPAESSADTSRHAMLGGFMLNHFMRDTRDAWLTHVEKRRGGPIVVPLDRPQIALEHRTGQDIVYPRAKLPVTINVRIASPAQVSVAL